MTLFDPETQAEEKGAIISKNGTYRYQLYRIWDRSKPLVLWVMLNPSKADGGVDDNTIKKLRRFTKAWGYGGFYVGNIFAYRSTDPKELKKVKADAMGLDNVWHILDMAPKCELRILAHGNSPIPKYGFNFKSLSLDWHYLRLTKKGNPYHPLYLKEDLKPIPFKP